MPVKPVSLAIFAVKTNLSIKSKISSSVIGFGIPYFFPGIFNLTLEGANGDELTSPGV